MILLFSLVFFLGSIIDYRVWKQITPMMVSYIGVYFVVLTHAMIGGALGFKEIDGDIYFYILLFYMVGLLASMTCAFTMALITKGIPRVSPNLNTKSCISPKRVLLVSTIIICVCAYFIYSAWTRLGSFVSEDFEELLTYGVPGHAFAILVAVIPFVLKSYYQNKNKFFLFLLLLMLSLLFMKQVKYWVMIPLVWILWYSIVSGYIRLSFKKIIVIATLMTSVLFLFFFSVYFMKVIFSSEHENLNYSLIAQDITIHFFGYLYSGVLTFSAYITSGMFSRLDANDIWGLFSGPVNVINILINEPLISLDITRPFVTLNSYSGSVGNVPSFWGTLLLAAGYYAYPLYFLMIFLLGVLQWFSSKSELILIIYAFLTSFLIFSWFDYYYYLLMPFEVCMLCIVFYFLFKKNGRKNIVKSRQLGKGNEIS